MKSHPFCTRSRWFHRWRERCDECDLEASGERVWLGLCEALHAKIASIPEPCKIHGAYECETCRAVDEAARANMLRRYVPVELAAPESQHFKLQSLDDLIAKLRRPNRF